MAGVEIRPATLERWDDVVTVFGRRGDDPSWCWCRRFLHAPGNPVQRDNRAALKDELAAAQIEPGLIAYVDDHPVGWTRVGPRDEFPGVLGNRALARLLEPDPGAWWVTCFAVDRAARGGGVGVALLEAAATHAREHGASSVEGHPVDVDASRRASPSAIFTGTMSMFLAAGFVEVGRTFASRPVMRLAWSAVGESA